MLSPRLPLLALRQCELHKARRLTVTLAGHRGLFEGCQLLQPQPFLLIKKLNGFQRD